MTDQNKTSKIETYREPALELKLENYSTEELKNAIRIREKLIISDNQLIINAIKKNGNCVFLKEIKIRKFFSNHFVYKILIANFKIKGSSNFSELFFEKFEFIDYTLDIGKLTKYDTRWDDNEHWVITNNKNTIIDMLKLFNDSFEIFEIS